MMRLSCRLRLASVPTTTRCLTACAACGLTTASDGTIKQLYNTLLGIEQPCDRYEYLCQLKELWYTYKSELQRYDDYQPDADNVDEQLSPADIAKEIANARSYITKYADKLLSLREATLKTDDAKAFEEYSALQKKVQKRVAVLADNKAPIGDELKAKLDEAGVFVPSAE